MVGADREIRRVWQEVADLAKECSIRIRISGSVAVLKVPRIDLGLQCIAFGEQCVVVRRQIAHQIGQSPPKRIRRNTGPGNGFAIDERIKRAGNLQTTDIDQVHSLQLLEGLTPGRTATDLMLRTPPAFSLSPPANAAV